MNEQDASHRNDPKRIDERLDPLSPKGCKDSTPYQQLRGRKGFWTTKRLAERLHSGAEKGSIAEWVTVLFTCVIAVATIFNVILVRGQLGAAILDQRPWLKIEMEAGADLEINEGRLGFGVRYEVINTGKTPATDVNVAMDLVPDDGPLISDAQKRLCDHPGFNQFLFPGDRTTTYVHFFSNKNVNEFRRKMQKMQIQSIISGPEKTNADISTYEMIVAGCVSYRFVGGSENHHTMFALNVNKKTVGESWYFEEGNQTIKGGNISLSRSVSRRNLAD